MDSELEEYKFQLSQVKEALEKDPENDDLLKLETHLNELIQLLIQCAEPEALIVAKEPVKPLNTKEPTASSPIKAQPKLNNPYLDQKEPSPKPKPQHFHKQTTKQSNEVVLGDITDPKPSKIHKKKKKKEVKPQKSVVEWQKFTKKHPNLIKTREETTKFTENTTQKRHEWK